MFSLSQRVSLQKGHKFIFLYNYIEYDIQAKLTMWNYAIGSSL